MRIRRLAVLSALLAMVTFVGSFPLPAAAQGARQDPYEVLRASAEAMINVQAARFDGSFDVQADSGGSSFSMAMTVAGAYSSPDRMHMTLDVGSLFGALGDSSASGPIEMIVIGDTMWMRMGATDWEPMSESMSSGGMTTSPADFNRNMQAISRFVPNAMLADAGTAWEVRGDLDLKAAMDEGMAMSSMMGMGMPASTMAPMSASDTAMLESMNARFSTRINKGTLYTEQMTMTMDMPDPSGGGGAVITIELVFSDFNSPSIVIEPPM